MAKTFGPLLSIDAKGTIAKGLTFQNRPKGSAVMVRPVPSRKSLDEPSPAKQVQRALVRSWVVAWQTLNAGQKAYWDFIANQSGLRLSGYHYFMKKKSDAYFLDRCLVGYWPFAMGSGDTLFDISGNNSNGELKPSYPGNVPSWVEGMNVKLPHALSFDGVDDYVDFGTSSIGVFDLGISDFTLEFWIKTTTTSLAYLLRKKSADGGASPGWFIRTTSAGKLSARIGDSGGSCAENVTTAIINDDEWHHVVVVFDRSANLQIFVDSVADVTTDISSYTGTVNSGAMASLGAKNGVSDFFDGLISGCKIYNCKLTPAEILDRYNKLK